MLALSLDMETGAWPTRRKGSLELHESGRSIRPFNLYLFIFRPMAKNKLETIVVRLYPDHPSGVRNRAGFRFTTDPIAVDVTPEQKQLIVDDRFLLIVEKGGAVKQALAARAQEEQKKQAPKEDQSNSQEGQPEQKAPEDVPPVDEGQGNNQGNDEEEDTNTMTKNEIIEALKAKGLEEGKGFDPRAVKADLLALLNSL